MSLEHRELVPSLHVEQPSPEIDFDSTPFYVNAKLEPWPANPKHPRRAGVSSFGVGGTNAHVVLQEAPALPASGPSRKVQALVLSARSATALDAATQRLAKHLRAHPEQSLADVARKEEERRKGVNQPSKVLTNDDLGAVPPVSPPPATLFGAADEAASSAEPGTDPKDEKAGEDKKDEKPAEKKAEKKEGKTGGG